MPHNTQTTEEITTPSSSTSEEDFSVTFASKENINGEETVILTSEQIAQEWMTNALKSFDPSNRQYSVYLNEESGAGSEKITLNELENLAKNAQSNLSKILKINSIVRQRVNEDDIIGKVYEAVIANLNANVRISFDNLPKNYKKKIKERAESIIKQLLHWSMLMTKLGIVVICISVLFHYDGKIQKAE